MGRRPAVLITCGVALLAGCRDATESTEPSLARPGDGKPRYVNASEHPGEWSTPFYWPVVAAHLALMPDGKVITWTSDDTNMSLHTPNVYVWDPSYNYFTQVPNTNTDVFCSAHTFLTNGDLLVSGGHIEDDHGSKDANIFRYLSGTWGRATSMRAGRWYPSSITLANGEAVTLGGADESGSQNTVPEVWTGHGWRALWGASLQVPYYPWIFQAPDGRVAMAGPDQATWALNLAGEGWWDYVSHRNDGARSEGTAVMYEPGKVLALGGGYPAKNTAEVQDLNAGGGWQYTNSMQYARRHVNATILANGQVLVTGGHSGPEWMNEGAAVLPAEIWDPATGQWTTVASMSVPRLYHSAAVLLPDARVLSAGGGRCGSACPNHLDAEIYSPPYLFNADGSPAARPSISGAPQTVGYGQQFSVQTPDAWDIGKVTLVRLSSVTHSFNMNQRFNDLSFYQAQGEVVVTAPWGGTVAPPGHYLLFILSSTGVPSVAHVIQLQGGGGPGPQPTTGPVISQHSGTCMDVDGTWSYVQIWGCHGGANQDWTVPPTGVSGEVRAYDGRCLDVSGGVGNDGDEIITYPCHGGANQQWTYTSDGELRGIHGKCLDVGGWNTADGSRLILWSCHGGANQKWTLPNR